MSIDLEPTEQNLPTIPGYRILGQLGTGGMATVYLAIQQSFDRQVALKVMAPVLAADASYGDRFMREARIAARFSHPNIIAVYDVGVHDNHYYIGMEYHPGGDLKGRLKQNMTTRRGMSILRQMAAALDYAHSKGYIHRDVKPDNIMFRDDGSAVLTDFGIARPAAGDAQMTQLGMVVGTPKYMSPEQARGQELDARSDIYSLGIVFYEMLIGRVPFDGKDSIDIGIKHVKDPVPPLPDHLTALQPLLDHMLAKNPEDRYARGRDLIAELDLLRMGVLRNQKREDSGPVRTVLAERVSAEHLSADRAAAPPTKHMPTVNQPLDDTIPPPPAPKSRRPWFRLMLVPVLLAGTAYYFYNSREQSLLWQQLRNSGDIREGAETISSWLAGTDGNTTTSLDTAGDTGSDAVTEAATQLAAGMLGAVVNSHLYPLGLPGQGIAAQATGVLADIDPGTLPQEDMQSRIIDEMLTEADRLLSAGRLVSPPDGNALASYRGVLTLDAGNPTAHAGLRAIAMHYIELTDQALAAKSLTPAAQHLQQARDVSPQLEEIAVRQHRIDQAAQEQQAQVSEARARAEQVQQAQQAEQATEEQQPRVNRADAMLSRFKVKGLLRSAEYDLAEGRYTSPEQNNALQKYRQVLQLSPGNAQARQGLRTLTQGLEAALDQALEAGDTLQAMALLQELKLVNPANPRIKQAVDALGDSTESPPTIPPG